ncbi:myeloperoxidase-like [Mizuhopecten yessoensis]|uniref:myeloperoxidase-like n=1 Tax=Mizuhopecten yessoensis TaxID=6573 RepID=UPI000B45F7DD|nr:myeloperoxidase-like [Mizuhopecten yessoensis]
MHSLCCAYIKDVSNTQQRSEKGKFKVCKRSEQGKDMMLSAKTAVLVICCLTLGNVMTKMTSDIYRELEEVLEDLNEETRGENAEESELSSDTLDEDSVDVATRSGYKITLAVKLALIKAKKLLEEEFVIRNRHFTSGIDFPPGGSSAASMAGLNDMVYGTEGEREENRTLIALFATEILLGPGKFRSLSRLRRSRSVKKVFRAVEGDNCDSWNRPVCNIDCKIDADSPFRRINGTCNNLKHPKWGSTGTPQVRLLNAEYEDGIGGVRTTGKNHFNLPSPRTVSRTVLRNESDLQTPDDPTRSVMVTVWGQFLDHDLTETPMTKGRNGTNVGCCSLSSTERAMRTQCATIEIEPGDPVYTRDCMDLVRSLPIRENPCLPGVREQVNAITSFVDGSQVYGSEEALAQELRAGTDGLMKVEGDNLLPANDKSTCLLRNVNDHCQLAGDVRVNENPHLGAIHIAFVRYHNILAKRFKALGLADDEEIYQRTRKIIGAIMQHVTYAVWLPDVIGDNAMRRFQLTLDDTDPYEKDVDPSGINEFSTAAMRYGHTLVSQNLLQLNEGFMITNDSDRLDNHFFRPDIISDSTQLQNLARWMVSLSCKKRDAFFVQSIHENLFVQKVGDGLDLSSLNIQRGREHGLPGYTKYRRLCGLRVPTSFSKLRDHTPWFRTKLKEVYKDVEDIDLFVGAMTENSVDDAHISSTFACLLGLQFRALKRGDRFWFERPLPQGMSQAQRDNIKSLPLAKIMCEVFGIQRIQENIFEIPRLNEFKACSDLPDINVDLWM